MGELVGAVVTGGGGAGIGSAVSRALAQPGTGVWVADADADAAEATAAQLRAEGGIAWPLVLDVADAEAVAGAAEQILARTPYVRSLVNSAGIGLNRIIGEVAAAEYDRVMGVNLRGAWLMTRAMLPAMTDGGGGSIVNVGSVHALGADRNNAVYAATKAGLVGFTRGVAADYGVHGVRANVVHPGAVDSPQTRALSLARGEDPERMLVEFQSKRQMLPRAVTAADVAAAVAFLCSDAAAAITGAELAVDGGLTAMLWDYVPIG